MQGKIIVVLLCLMVYGYLVADRGNNILNILKDMMKMR